MATQPSHHGRIGVATLPRVVRDLRRARASGTLHLSHGDTTKRIAFKDGDIIFAATNVEHERLGERLVRAGKINRPTLDLACRVIERSHERFGKTIVDLGWVSPWEMQSWVAKQIKDIVYSVFVWDTGEYRFEPADEPVPRDLVLELQTSEVIYEGARRISDLKAIRTGIGSPSQLVRIVDGERLRIPVTHEDGFILSRVNGRATIQDIVSTSPLGEEETLRRVYALLLAGVLELERSPARESRKTVEAEASAESTSSEDEQRFRDGVVARHAAMKFGNLYDRLGVDYGASEKQIRDAYEEVMKSLEPGPGVAGKIGDLERRLDQVKRKVVEAYETLIDPDRRRQYDRSLSGGSPESTVAAETFAASTVASASAHTVLPQMAAKQEEKRETNGKDENPDGGSKTETSRSRRQEAELHCVEANRHLQAGDYFDAIASLSEAVRLDPERGMYHRLLGKLLAQNPSCAEAAQAHFERAVDLDPGDQDALTGLAELYEEAGLSDKAHLVYEKLARLDPRNGGARDPQDGEEPKGLAPKMKLGH